MMVVKEQPFPIQLRSSMEQRGAEFAAMLGPLDVSHERFMRIALLYVTKNPKLWECSKQSVFLSIMEAARAGLMVDGKEAAIIPYKGVAEFMPMVSGIINLILRSPDVLKVEARVVREGDDFDCEYGLQPNLVHRPLSLNGEITHAYAIMWRPGTEPTFEVMDREELELARSMSRAPDSPAYRNWLAEMYRKIVLKRLSKYADLSPEASRAIAIDHAVTGDPRIAGYVDGPSDEYQNLLVKNQTQAGINRLKEEMADNGAGGDVEVDDDSDSDDELERAKQFVKEQSGERVNYVTEFWELTKRLGWDKHTVADFVVGLGFEDVSSMSKEDFQKAYEALKEQHGGPDG